MHSTTTENQRQTGKLAAGLARELIDKKTSKALVIALEGELGAGKTTFIKGFSKALGIREKVHSPTFVLIHRHKIRGKNLYHVDAYRLKSGKDLLKLGVKEIFAEPKNIVLIEWANRVKRIIPKNAVWIRLEHLSKNERKVIIK